MENASKALIIAGAILLAILLISLGIMVYNQASGVVASTAMDEVAVTSFNKKFTQYEGSNVRGTQVNALLDTIIQNNLSNSDDESKIVNVLLISTAWLSNGHSSIVTSGNRNVGSNPAIGNFGKANQGKSYKVECIKDPKSGYITTIKITNA